MRKEGGRTRRGMRAKEEEAAELVAEEEDSVWSWLTCMVGSC